MDRHQPLSALSLGRKLVDIIQNGDSRQAEKLLKQGADPNAVQSEGVTPFHFAVGQEGAKSLELTRLFLAYGADPNVRCGEGMTPLHTAATWGNVECLKLLLANGGDPQLHDRDGLDCLDLASQYENPDCVDILLSYLSHTETPEDTSCKYTLVPYDDVDSLSLLTDDDHEPLSVSPSKSVFRPNQRRTTLYNQDINQMLSRYLEEGVRESVILDVTSPAHPYIEAKRESESAIARSDCSIDDEILADKTGSSDDSFVTCASGNEDAQLGNVSVEHTLSRDMGNCFGDCRVQSYLKRFNPAVTSSPPNSVASGRHLVKSGTCAIPVHNRRDYGLNGFHDDSGFEAATSWGEISSISGPQCCGDNVNCRIGKTSQCPGSSHSFRQQSICPCSHHIPSFHHHGGMSQSPVQYYPTGSSPSSHGSCIHTSYSSPRSPGAPLSCHHFHEHMCTGDRRRAQNYCSPTLQEQCVGGHGELHASPLHHPLLHPSTCSGTCTSGSYTSGLPHRQHSSQTELLEDLGSLHLNDNRHNRWETPNLYASKQLTASTSMGKLSEQHVRCSVQDINPESDNSIFSHISIKTPVHDKTLTHSSTKLQGKGGICTASEAESMAEFLPDDFNLSDLTLNTRSDSPVSELNRQVFIYPHDRTSLDSANSLASTMDYIYTDPEKGITLIERRCPSVVSASSVRTSLDSVSSGMTAELDNSQSTVLYDWRNYIGSSKTCRKGSETPSVSSEGSYDSKTPVGLFKSHDSDKTLMNTPKSSSAPAVCVSGLSDQSPKKREIPPLLKKLSNQELRTRLTGLGDEPGPITKATRQTYLCRLVDLENNPDISRLVLSKDAPGYSAELRHALGGRFDCGGLEELEGKMVEAFQKPRPDRKWREGTLKSSFNYLLLDPRVAQNLPLRAPVLGEAESFKTFISSIFYVGKGKRSRPYCHLYEAISHRKSPQDKKPSEKVQRILNIWGAGLGVISLHIFQNVIPVEAYTREACMVDAFGLGKLTNKKKGDYYGISSTWGAKQRRQIGVYLLKKAMKIFLAEGERQICPPDIGIGQ